MAISLPGFVMNLVQLRGDERLTAIFVRHLRFVVPAALATPFGALLVARLDPDTIRLVLGLVVLAWLGLPFVRVTLALGPARERWAAPLLGVANGVVGGATSIFFPILAIYLIALKLEKRRFVQHISLVFALQQALQLAALAPMGAYTAPRLLYVAVVCVPVAVGFAVGQASQARIDQARFMRAVRAILALTALQLVYRGIVS